MKTKQITTGKGTFFVSELSKGIDPVICCGRCHKPDSDEEDCWSAKNCSRGYDFNDYLKIDSTKSWAVEGNRTYLPKGNWQLLGKLTELTEDRAHDIVDKVHHYDRFEHIKEIKTNFLHEPIVTLVEESSHKDVYTHSTICIDELNSLLQSNDIWFENILGEEPKQSHWKYWTIHNLCMTDKFKSDYDKWIEAEQKVWNKENIYIFKLIE